MPYVFNPFTGNLDWTVDGLPTLTTGGVTFGSSTGTLAQDATNFNFDNSTDQLSISQVATERLTNGSFTGSASGWTLTTGWAYASNAVSHTTNGTGTLSQIPTLQWGERWEISFTLSAFTAGSVTVAFGGNTLGTFSSNGTYVFRVTNTNVGNGIAFAPTNTARFTVDNVSAKVLTGGRVNTGDLYVQGSGSSGTVYISATAKSNGSPGTTRHLSLENGGLASWIDFKFSGTDKAHIGANSSGEISTWVSGGNYDVVYNKNTNSIISFNAPSSFGHYGFGGFQNGVNAGSTTTPTSTLMSQGGTALKVKYISANQTLDNTATEWIVDPSTPICSGSPSNACSSYNNETDCLARDAHGGCTWFAGYSCSVYNGDQGACEGQAGCTYESASCSGFGDQTTCESYSGCSWTNDPQSCVGFDQSTCDSTSGCTSNFGYCTVNYDQCSNYNNDQTGCDNANGGGFCTYDSGTGDCTGGQWFVSCSGGAACSSQPDESSCQSYSYFDNCSGNYDSYSCTGSYYTGNCTGTYGAACSGTATCGGIDDQTNCNNEPGCSWATAITLTLPQIVSVPDRDYWIYNTSSTNADVVIVPATGGDTIDHTTSYTLSNYKDWVHISPLRRTSSCSGLNEATCGSTSGCTQQYSNCSWNSIDSLCEGDPSCSGYGDQSSCQAATYFSACTGSYVVSSNWYVFGR